MPEAVIAADVRSPFTFAHQGALAGVRPEDLGTPVVRAVLQQAGLKTATDGRLVGKAARRLKREGRRFGLATQCIGAGMDIAMVLEALQ